MSDLVPKLNGENLIVNSIRVQKSVASTEFGSVKAALENFQAPFLLSDRMQRALQCDVINPNPKREMFYTE
jgi:hypothetical protein